MVPVSFDAVHAIAQTFRTSIVASAVRYVELASTPCAVVYSERGHVVWAKRSRTFPGRIPPQLRIGAGAAAVDHHARKVLAAAPRVAPSATWLGGQSPHPFDGSLVEQAELVPEPGWGGVLSLSRVDHGESTRASAC